MSDSANLQKEIVNELQIIFIYDRLSCRREEDDPNEAILYFHPPEIPEEKRVAICGQLMGVTHFLLDAFSAPKILTLANGKFALRTFEKQYVLALGCSTATPDWFLDKQADILYQLTRFFHSDIQSVLSRVDGDRLLLSKKLTTMMEHYIPISQRHGDLFALTFGILPILYLPKTANGISIQASLILQTCLMMKGVLGGIVMYQNKVVAVELGQDLAQKLAFIQPYRMPPADTVKVDFKLPMGVQLLVVYLTQCDLEELKQNSARFQRPSTSDQHSHNNNNKGINFKVINLSMRNHTVVVILLKVQGIILKKKYQRPETVECKYCTAECINYKRNLKYFEKEKLGLAINSIREEEPSPSEDSSNLSSVMLEGEMSNAATQVEVDVVNGSFIVSPIHERDTEDLRQGFNESANEESGTKSFEEFSPTRRKYQSLTDNSLAHLSCQHLKTNVPGLNNTCYRCKSNEDLSSSTIQKNEMKLLPSLRKYSSIADPVFPFIRCDGISMSHFLVKSFADVTSDNEIENESLVSQPSNSSISDEEVEANNCSTIPVVEQKQYFSSPSEPQSPSFNVVNQIPDSSSSSMLTPSSVRRPIDLPISKIGTPILPKKQLWSTIEDMISPISPLHSSSSDEDVRKDSKLDRIQGRSNGNRKQLPQSEHEKVYSNHNRYLNTFRKLSSHDNSTSYSSSENETNHSRPLYSSTTSPEIKKSHHEGVVGIHSPRKNYTDSIIHTKINRNKKENTQTDEIYTRASIFMYCFGTMRLLIVLDPSYEDNLELINTLWAYGSSSIIDLKEAVTSVEEQSQFSNQNDPYCFLRYESVWKSLAHGGRNEVMDFNTVQLMHRDFTSFPNIHELIIRGEDHVVYGYQCVGSEVYYQQSAGLQPGLPMPSDLMGKVPQKAKRRLERDHSILIL